MFLVPFLASIEYVIRYFSALTRMYVVCMYVCYSFTRIVIVANFLENFPRHFSRDTYVIYKGLANKHGLFNKNISHKH
jgi:hypothetical protein